MTCASDYFVNGDSVDHNLVDDRAFSYADGVFETLLFARHTFPFLQYHLERLNRGCERLAIHYDNALLTQTLELIGQTIHTKNYPSAKVKLILSRIPTTRGCYPQSGVRAANIYGVVTPRDELENGLNVSDSVAVIKAMHPLYEHPNLTGIKHLNRLNYIVAAKDNMLEPHQELLFVDGQGKCIETMHHNIFFVKGGALYTPSLVSAGVEGVMRRVIMEEYASDNGFNIEVVDIFYNDLEQFSSAFLCNAISGVTAVRSIDGLEMQLNCTLQNHIAEFIFERVNYER